MKTIRLVVFSLLVCLMVVTTNATEDVARSRLKWESLPDLPDTIGVAGPFVGVHSDALIVAGGANFAEPDADDLWDVPKLYHDDAWVLIKKGATHEDGYEWIGGFKLKQRVGYGACVSTKHGVVCIGGNDATRTHDAVFLLKWDPKSKQLTQVDMPTLPTALTSAAAAVIGDFVYVAGGQTGPGLETATTFFARINVSLLGDNRPDDRAVQWEMLPAWPGPVRSFVQVAAQHNGFNNCLYVIGGRNQKPNVTGIAGIDPLADVYEFDPSRYDAAAFDAKTSKYTGRGEHASPWRRRADAPKPIMAGTAAPFGQSHIFILGHADGDLLKQIEEDESFAKRHPGFPKRSWAYHTITDTWIDAGSIPSNQVTTPTAAWDGAFVVASGEIKPRVRSRQVWRVTPVEKDRSFGAVNFTVLVVYLLAMVGVGVWFTRKNKDTDDYFRGGKKVVWWAAACSIFATMLSSITYMAIPAKAYAQDWVYLIGNLLIWTVAPVAVFVALPFFRRIDATSAYEYLEKRFNRGVRLSASTLFMLFHVFRMGIVLSLAAIALATITPLDAAQSVLVMGVLSIIYCTMGGVEAVIWTDTIQTVVLLGGALVCGAIMLAGIDGGFSGMMETASAKGKTHAFNFHLDPTSASLALWVVFIGAITQNVSSYTADQAVVQRYMTTPDQKRAARSIWLAAFMTIPASLLFYGLGTALFTFYHAHPERLDPTFTTDQIFPLFIAEEVPVGVAGLIVAGIFAAAQSTVSTSMNSTATAFVTDFLRPFNRMKTERGYLNAARAATFLLGVTGTLIGLLFVQPDIKSLFDEFIGVVGLFMGVLGGLFLLGMTTRRASGVGALIGVICGAGLLFALKQYSAINGYLYAAIGLTTCFVVGYVVSFVFPQKPDRLRGMTVFTLDPQSSSPNDT